jgi:hypothetical protein
MAELVYILCALASATCAALLIRSFRRTREKLSLWTSLCFVGLALNNVVLCIDLLVVPSPSLSLLRGGLAVCALGVLLFGLIWESP